MARATKYPAAITNAVFKLTDSNAAFSAFIDSGQSLSLLNRRLMKQGRAYYISSIEIAADGITPEQADDQIRVTVSTVQNNWISKNAWVKSKALFDEMNDKVLQDNPSLKAKWHDFKVHFDTDNFTGLSIRPVGGGGATLNYTTAGQPADGEWEISKFVMPQHEIDPATGFPLPAREFEMTLNGAGNAAIAGGATGVQNMITAYQLSRARQHEPAPDVDPLASSSFFNILTDDGGQEPELADVLEDANDMPPYSNSLMFGGTTGLGQGGAFPENHRQHQGKYVLNMAENNVRTSSMIAPCGYVGFEVYNPTSAVLWVKINYKLGSYRGVHAPSMEA